MHGAASFASSNNWLMFSADSSTHFDVNSLQWTFAKLQPISPANAFTKWLFRCRAAHRIGYRSQSRIPGSRSTSAAQAAAGHRSPPSPPPLPSPLKRLGARLAEIEPYGWNQDVTQVTDTIVSWNLDLQCLISPEVDAEAAYEFARVSHEHGDTIREADPTYADHSNPEDMTVSVIPEHPVHQGITEFYQDQDVWDESWQAGGETEETTTETEETTTG